MKVAIFYPWPDLLKRTSGASLRAGLLIDYLKERCAEIIVFSVDNRPDISVGNVRYLFIHRNDSDSVQTKLRHSLSAKLIGSIIFKLSIVSMVLKLKPNSWMERFFTLGSRFGQMCNGINPIRIIKKRVLSFLFDPNSVLFLRCFYQYRSNQDFKSLAESIIAQSDVVFLEYPFWARIIVPICRKYKVPCILTSHDVLASTHGKFLSRSMLLFEELAALRSASYTFCVSELDSVFFRRHGIDAQVIPNPINITSCYLKTRDEIIQGVKEKYDLFDKSICLFVGSAHPPNFKAVGILEDIASKLPCYTFVIAGSCTNPGRINNFIKLGVVTDEELRVLYTIADLIVIPLRGGTGSSLKLIEALAYGKAILTTTVGCRGYDFVNNVHGIISDNLEEYPDLIVSLLENTSRTKQFSNNARVLAKQYDYKNVYDAYWKILCKIKSIRDAELTYTRS